MLHETGHRARETPSQINRGRLPRAVLKEMHAEPSASRRIDTIGSAARGPSENDPAVDSNPPEPDAGTADAPLKASSPGIRHPVADGRGRCRPARNGAMPNDCCLSTKKPRTLNQAGRKPGEVDVEENTKCVIGPVSGTRDQGRG